MSTTRLLGYAALGMIIGLLLENKLLSTRQKTASNVRQAKKDVKKQVRRFVHLASES